MSGSRIPTSPSIGRPAPSRTGRSRQASDGGVENTIDLHNLHNPEVSLTPDVEVVVTGGETEQNVNLGMLVASNIGRNLVEGKNPLNAPSDFPYDSMVVNVGLALWDV